MKELILTCAKCGKEFTIEATDEQFKMLQSHAYHIQDIFPEVSPDIRELFISGICGECFDDLFKDEEDE
jgi:hypothetical protein